MSELKVIKFEKPSCAPCEAVSQMLNNAGVEHEKINYILSIDLAQQMGVRTVPTVFAVRIVDGKQVIEHVVKGANPVEINAFIEKVASYRNATIANEH